MSELVSLVMPVWRTRRDWLRAAVASALDEQACEVELIVVDDGSDDDVAAALADIDDPRLTVLRVEHGGPYAARNAGIRVAKGTYFRFVDSDDIVEPGSTGRLLDLARLHSGALAYGATMMCDDALVPQRVVASTADGDAAEECVLGGFEVYVVSILFSRAVVEAVPWEERAFSVSGDWDFVLRALERAPVCRLDEVVTRYRRHPTSVSKAADVRAGARAGHLVLDRYFERHPDQRGTTLERRAYLRLHLDRAGAHASRRELRLAARQLVAAGRRDPWAAFAATACLALRHIRDLLARASRRVRKVAA